MTDVVVAGETTEHYEYDGNGNRLRGVNAAGIGGSSEASDRSGTYDDQDRMLTYGEYSYEYTANGELTTKTNTATGEVTAYTYDVLGNLRSVNLPDGRLVEYVVDGQNRRVAKLVDGVATKRWLWSGQLRVAAELDGSGVLTAQYIYGEKANVPELLLTDGKVYRVVTDHLGSPIIVVNTADVADVLFQGEYSAFGERTLLVGAEDAIPFAFAGGMCDSDTGLVRFGARDYDALAGRWTGKDPIRWRGGQRSLFAYSGGDPTSQADPSGLAVYLCERVADLPGNEVFGIPHRFLLTDSKEAGMGPCGGGIPGHGGSDPPYGDTCINDHSAENESSVDEDGIRCEWVPDADEECVNRQLQIGAPLGPWSPWNQCHSFAADVLHSCRSGVPPCEGEFSGGEGAPNSCGG